jgi:hypothetical protein
MKQTERILAFMRQWGCITQMSGSRNLGITCTSQRICDLKRQGYDIVTRFGTSKAGGKYAIYSLGTKRKAK